MRGVAETRPPLLLYFLPIVFVAAGRRLSVPVYFILNRQLYFTRFRCNHIVKGPSSPFGSAQAGS